MNVLKKFFLWCSGTDEQTLNMVQERDRKSIGYQVMYGALVLVPTTMAFVGMAHAASNFSDNKHVWIISGFIFASMIFAFDRFIVQTYKKGNTKLFWARITISIPLGFIIAIFGILLAFHKEIDKQIDENITNKLSDVETVYLQKEDSLRSEILVLESDIRCLEILKTYEQAGRDTVLPCGTSSGKAGQWKRFDELNQQISDKKKEITKEESRINNAVNRNNTLRDNETKEIDSMRGKDPLTALLALIQVIKKKMAGIIFVLGLFLLLIALDLFPILAKAVTQATLYDNVYRSDDTTEIDMKDFLKKTQTEFDNYTPPSIQKINETETANNKQRIIAGIITGIIIAPIIIVFGITDFTNNTVISSTLVSLILSIPIGIGTGYVANIIPNYFKNKKQKENE
ncbi:hypothetical protein FACS1894123_02950 [Bacteroidia bacterium]|nr:hypothetical protein FACS1894123_02950 [Bacteroidia bacterium]